MSKVHQVLGGLSRKPDLTGHNSSMPGVLLTVGGLSGDRPYEADQPVLRPKLKAHIGIEILRPVLADGQILTEAVADIKANQGTETRSEGLPRFAILTPELPAGFVSQTPKPILLEPKGARWTTWIKNVSFPSDLAELHQSNQRSRPGDGEETRRSSERASPRVGNRESPLLRQSFLR